MNITRLSLITIFSAVLLVFINSCTEDTSSPVDNEKYPGTPTNLQATSKDATSIMIRWEAPADTSEQWPEFSDYKVVVRDESNQEVTGSPFYVVKENKSLTVTGLTEGMIYDISVRARLTNGNESGVSAEISWSPASRFVRTGNGVDIQIHETDSDFGSGLDLYNPDDEGPAVVTVGLGDQWNLGLYTTGGVVNFGSASQLSYNYTGTPQDADISVNYFVADSLDDVYDTEALNAGNFITDVLDLTDTNLFPTTNNIVFIVRTMEPGETEYNYAKVLLKRGSGGELLQGNAGNRYIECEVSYQMKAGVPYAKIPSGN